MWTSTGARPMSVQSPSTSHTCTQLAAEQENRQMGAGSSGSRAERLALWQLPVQHPLPLHPLLALSLPAA